MDGSRRSLSLGQEGASVIGGEIIITNNADKSNLPIILVYLLDICCPLTFQTPSLGQTCILNTLGRQENVMTATYALSIRLETYEYEGEFYIVGDGYETPGDVLQHVAADHILAIDRTHHVEQYLLDVLNAGTNTSETAYKTLDADIACGLHADVYYQRFSFWTGDKVVEIGHNPTESTLASIADDLRSEGSA